MGRALWLADAFRDAGVRFGRVTGWETRGHDGLQPRCVVCHHIGIGGNEDSPGLNVVTNGRPGLRNALCNLHLSRSGLPTIVASGVAWHAGKGGYRGLSGNPSALGIEAEGTTGQPMPPAEREGYEITVAVLLDGIDRYEDWCCAHHEWRAEKPDPWGLLHAPGGMDAFRSDVGQLLNPSLPEEEDMALYVLQADGVNEKYVTGTMETKVHLKTQKAVKAILATKNAELVTLDKGTLDEIPEAKRLVR